MLKDCVAILDIGSSSINLIVGEYGVNGTFVIRASESEDYYAFYEREFSDIKVLESKISSLIKRVIDNSDIRSITKIFVGVPGEFSKTFSNNYKITFSKVKKITEKEVKALLDLGYTENDCEYSLMHRSAVYYLVDNLKTHQPIKKQGRVLGGRLSYSLVSNNFKEVVTAILKKCKITTVKFISIDYCLSQYLFSISERDECRVLIDVGSATTSLSIISGDGLLYSSAFSVGGGLITAYLSDHFSCEYEVAEKLKRKLNLSLRNNKLANYLVFDNIRGDFSFNRDKANEIAKNILDELAEKCDKALSNCTLKIPSDVEVCFTGGGICFIRGAVEYISLRLGVFPKIVYPNLPKYSKPNYSSRLALLSTSIKYKDDKLFFEK